METVETPPEQRTVLSNISWETYERLLADHLDSSSPRSAYDRGVLEITVVSERHERPNRLIAQLVEVLAEELDLDLDNLGSTTYKKICSAALNPTPASTYRMKCESAARPR